jgi:hypothetical protein
MHAIDRKKWLNWYRQITYQRQDMFPTSKGDERYIHQSVVELGPVLERYRPDYLVPGDRESMAIRRYGETW